MTPLNVLPEDVQRLFRAQLQKATPTDAGVFRLVAIRTTEPAGFEAQRIKVLVVDEAGAPLPNIPVAFAYDTANFFTVGEDFLWEPPLRQAFIVPTGGGWGNRYGLG